MGAPFNMTSAATAGFVADFKTGYLQRTIPLHLCAVIGGTDVAYDGRVGFAVGRLVKITSGVVNGLTYYIMRPATTVTATSIDDATHIIAQSDDSVRTVITDAIPAEKYTTRTRNIVQNTFTPVLVEEGGTSTYTTPDPTNMSHWKTVAVYKIVNTDDVKIIPVKPATGSVVR